MYLIRLLFSLLLVSLFIAVGTADLFPENETGDPSGEIEDPAVGMDAESAFYEVISSPPGAAVTFDGILRETTPVTIEVLPSDPPDHTLVLEMDGYETWTSSFLGNPPGGTTETINADLTPLHTTGGISVISDPAGATASLDGSAIQTTPCTFTNVTAGSHTITISRDGYQPFSSVVEVTPGSTATVSVTLVPVTSGGALTVTSFPPGAAIILNDIAMGTTPARFAALSPGSYTVRLILPGFSPYRGTVEITAGRESQVNSTLVRQVPVTGSLRVSSTPPGGVVSVDVKKRGVTPITVRDLSPGSHPLRVAVPGYLDWIGFVDISAGRTTSLHTTLSPKVTTTGTGTIRITSDPSGASVVIDHQERGNTPLLVQNLAGSGYEVTISKPGYDPVTMMATVSPGKTVELSVTLDPTQEENLTAAMMALSDEAEAFRSRYGTFLAMDAFTREESGFTRENVYVIALDVNGTIRADGGHPELIGTNFSALSDIGGVYTGQLLGDLASGEGGFCYDLLLAGDTDQVSLVYVRPTEEGIIIGTVIPVPEISFPDPPSGEDIQKMVQMVRSAGDQQVTLMADQDPSDLPDIRQFSWTDSGTEDQYGVNSIALLRAAARTGTGFVWLPRGDDTEQTTRLDLGYAARVSDEEGMFGSLPQPEDLVMMETVPVT